MRGVFFFLASGDFFSFYLYLRSFQHNEHVGGMNAILLLVCNLSSTLSSRRYSIPKRSLNDANGEYDQDEMKPKSKKAQNGMKAIK